jgi:hypothetical protein
MEFKPFRAYVRRQVFWRRPTDYDWLPQGCGTIPSNISMPFNLNKQCIFILLLYSYELPHEKSSEILIFFVALI